MQQITENPYLQYFIGLEEYQLEPPFDPSLMVYFRKRLDKEILNKINEMICQRSQTNEPKDPGEPGEPPLHDNTRSEQDPKPAKPTNKGKLQLDATCAPADIRYPTCHY